MRRLHQYMSDEELAPRCLGWLRHPRTPWVLVLAGAVLTLASVGSYLAFDDYVLGLAARGEPDIAGLAQDGFDLFTFTTGRPADNRALMDQGFLLPWWTDESLRIAFYRPIASLTHRIDFALWPHSPSLMHLHSVAWFAVALGAVASLFRRVESSAVVAGLATLIYAIDDAHGPAVSWVSNRNALIATALGALAIIVHDDWRCRGGRWTRALACLLLAGGLLAGEFALGAGGYLVAYAVCLERGRLVERLGTVLPYAVVVVLWRLGHQWAGFGAEHSGAYLDPMREPGGFFAALPTQVLVLVHGQLGAPPSDLAFLGPPEHRGLFLGLAAVTLVAAAAVFGPVLRREPKARFWALGAVLAAIPVSASFPSDRLLLFVGIGAAALFARAFAALFDGARRRAMPWWRRGVAAGFAFLHLVVAPVLLPIRSAQFLAAGRLATRSTDVLDGIPNLERRTAVILNAPVDILASYVQAERAWRGRSRPAHLHWLASASSALSVARASDRSLIVRPREGYLYAPLERHYRGDARSLGRGATVTLTAMTARVLENRPDGRPAAVEFVFSDVLESGQYVFLVWRGNRYEVVRLPPVGASITLPREDFARLSLSSMIR